MLASRILRLFAVKIPSEMLLSSFCRSSGPGGQNVNKVNTKADVRISLLSAKWLSEETIQRAQELYPNSINKEGEMFVSSQSER
jgi:peptidyl-tRNA hydrolase ICT1